MVLGQIICLLWLCYFIYWLDKENQYKTKNLTSVEGVYDTKWSFLVWPLHRNSDSLLQCRNFQQVQNSQWKMQQPAGFQAITKYMWFVQIFIAFA